MGRLLAIDYGKVRTGVAVTDPLKIICTPLETVDTQLIFKWLTNYFLKEKVELIIVGMPKRLNNTPSENAARVELFIGGFKKRWPEIPVYEVEERFSSQAAFQSMIDSGLSKKGRAQKGTVDMVSAAILLQEFMDSREWQSLQIHK